MLDLFSCFMITKFCRDLSGYEKIAVYGAGMYAGKLLEILKRENISVAFFVVSKREKNEMENIPIYAFGDCVKTLQRESVITVIAVDMAKEGEIRENLDRCNVRNYLCINRYFRKYADVMLYQNRTKKDYLNAVIDWYTDIFGFQNAISIDELTEDAEIARNPKKIAFVVEMAKPRVLKMLKELILNGFHVTTLLRKSACGYNGIHDELRKNSTVVFEFECVEEVMFYLFKSRSYIVHIFSAWADCSLSYVLINQKELFSKVVLERYDIINGMYYKIRNYTEEEFERLLMLERFCLEHADGVCFRSFAEDFLKEELNFRFGGKTLIFLDYFEESNELLKNVSEILDYEVELSLCYVGGIVTERDSPNYAQACFLELGQKCEANRCHLHIYPIYWDEEKWRDYIELDQKSKYFHFHKPMENTLLNREISKYDYGIHPVRKNIFESKNLGNLTCNAVLYAGVNKFFDYLCAGLPIIAAEPVMLVEQFETKEILIRWALEEYDFDELRKKKKQMKEKVKRNRNSFMIKNQIQRLMVFYNEL